MKICPFSRILCTILSWKKYEIQKLPMGLRDSPDIFQEKMYELFNSLDYIKTYIDDLLIISRKFLKDYIKKLDIFLNKLK